MYLRRPSLYVYAYVVPTSRTYSRRRRRRVFFFSSFFSPGRLGQPNNRPFLVHRITRLLPPPPGPRDFMAQTKVITLVPRARFDKICTVIVRFFFRNTLEFRRHRVGHCDDAFSRHRSGRRPNVFQCHRPPAALSVVSPPTRALAGGGHFGIIST